MAPVLRFALDQNFPVSPLEVGEMFPEAELTTLHQIDPRLGHFTDRDLILHLAREGWHGLVTNNHKMLDQPSEVAAMLKARIAIFVVEGLGHDPVRATGAVLLHLSAILKKVAPGKPQVFHTNPRAPHPVNPWEFMQRSARHRGLDPAELYAQVRVTDEERDTPAFS